MAIAMGVSFLTVFVNPIISARSEAVMRLARRMAPKKILDALDVYRRAVGSISQSVADNGKLRDFLPHLAALLIYTLMFCGVMFAATGITNYIESESTPYPDWLALGFWAVAAVLSMPFSPERCAPRERACTSWLTA